MKDKVCTFITVLKTAEAEAEVGPELRRAQNCNNHIKPCEKLTNGLNVHFSHCHGSHLGAAKQRNDSHISASGK